MPDSSNLLYPGDNLFDYYLATLPLNWKELAYQFSGQIAYIAEPRSGLLRPANTKELTEYLYGGEYEERLKEIEDADEINELE